jgi:type II secretory pathway component PulM
MHLPLYPRYPMHRRLRGFRARVDDVEGRIALTLPGFEPRDPKILTCVKIWILFLVLRVQYFLYKVMS